MKKTISVIQIGQCPSNPEDRDWASPDQYSTPERPQYLVDFEYSQGHLSWESTDNPLEAMNLHDCSCPDGAILHFISGVSKKDKPELQGKIRTFSIEIQEQPCAIQLQFCPKCGDHSSIDERTKETCVSYRCRAKKL